MNKKPIIFGAITIFLVIFAIIIVGNYQTKTSFKYKNMSAEELKPVQNEQDIVQKTVIEHAQDKENNVTEEPRKIANEFPENDKTLSSLVNVIEQDIILGDINAPITIIEYASLSCPHCAYFVRDAFPKLKNEYIDQGKVRFVYRDFPLNHQAVVAGVIASCHAQNNDLNADKYYDFLKILFKTQDKWAFDREYVKKLEAIAKIDGISPEQFQQCLADTAIQDKILKHRMLAGNELQIKSTPTFFINGVKSSGFTDYMKLKNIIEQELQRLQN